MDEVQESTGPSGQSQLEAYRNHSKNEEAAAQDGQPEAAGFGYGAQSGSNQRQSDNQDRDYAAYVQQYNEYGYAENAYDQIPGNGYDYAAESTPDGGNGYAAAAFPGYAAASGDYVYPLASQF